VYVPRVRGNPEALRWVQDYLLHMGAFPRGRHDDWADSTTQALNWLRQSGILIRREEQRAVEAEEREYRKPDAPLYPV
jgi:phage terminase large subunit-like protein